VHFHTTNHGRFRGRQPPPKARRHQASPLEQQIGRRPRHFHFHFHHFSNGRFEEYRYNTIRNRRILTGKFRLLELPQVEVTARYFFEVYLASGLLFFVHQPVLPL
jgi:hypothetical protein